MRMWRRRIVGAIVLALILSAIPAMSVSAIAPMNPRFEREWSRTDLPVANQSAVRSWMWGPGGFTAVMWEEYEDAPGGWRLVQYFDKSRMEDNSWQLDDAPWDVTNGRLAAELITGELQVGSDDFIPLEPADVNVAGDSDDTSGVTYAFLGNLLDVPGATVGTTITRYLTPGGGSAYTNNNAMAAYGVTDAYHFSETGHTVASPFWDFMNASGLIYENGNYVNGPLHHGAIYATGYPITDAYWANIKVAGTQRDVLVQCFERRCLTYTPENPVEWRVEMGNVGQHYYLWRHLTNDIPSEPPAIDISDYHLIGPAPLVVWPFDLGGESLVIIQNDSPYTLQITLDGPVSQTITIDPNPDAIVLPSEDAFLGCDEDGPAQELYLPPGNYRIKREFIGGNVESGRGYWTLIPDAAYAGCHYVVEQ